MLLQKKGRDKPKKIAMIKWNKNKNFASWLELILCSMVEETEL